MTRLLEEVRKDWPKIFIQVFVLVSGITISFLLNEWRTEANNREIEFRTLDALRDNLLSDSASISITIDRIQLMISAYEQLLQPDVARALPDDSLDRAMDLLNTYTGFTRKDMAYEELRQTGNSRLIENKALLSGIIDLYHSAYDRAKEWEDINRKFILERMLPFVDAESPFAGGSSKRGTMVGTRPAYEELVNDDRFLNLMKTNLLFKNAQQSVYVQTLGEVTAVIEAIELELQRLD